jgi:hypothetical protein
VHKSARTLFAAATLAPAATEVALATPSQAASPGRMDGPVRPGLGPHVAARHRYGAARRTHHVPDVQVLHTDHIETVWQVAFDEIHVGWSSPTGHGNAR